MPLVLETLANFLFSISNISKLESFQLSYLIETKRRKRNKKHLPLRGRGSIVGVDIVLALTKITIRDGGRTVLTMFTNLVKADM